MSKNKRGSGADLIYAKHNGRSPYNQNVGSFDEQLAFSIWERQLINLAANRFKWDGLPSSIDVRFMELTLCYYGLSVYYHDRDLDVDLAVQGSGTAYVNMLQNPVAFTIIGPAPGFTPNSQTMGAKTLSAYNPVVDYEKAKVDPKTKCIPIWANWLRTPDIDAIQMYARRLAMIDRTIEINVKAARQPKVLKANQNTRLTLENINRQIDQGADVLVINGEGMDLSDLEVLDFGIDPKQLSELHILKTRYWNEIMGILGIDNSNQDKKERLVASEVDANNGQTDSFRFVQLNARRQAADYIKTVFGHDVKVEFNVEVEAQAKIAASQMGVEDGNSKQGKEDE